MPSFFVSAELDGIIENIDARFGAGFAKKNPGLVGDLMKAAATYEAGKSIAQFLGRSDAMTLSEAVTVLGRDVRDAIESAGETVGASVSDVSSSVDILAGTDRRPPPTTLRDETQKVRG